MSTQQLRNVIHEKARAARAKVDARAMSPSKALRLSLERACDRLFDLALAVGAVEQRKLTLEEIAQEVAGDGLIALLEGRGAAPAAAVLDRQIVQALVEVQTVGRVISTTAPERAFTGTDAAICAPLLDAMMSGFDDKLAEQNPAHRRAGFRFGDRIEDVHGLMLVLEEPRHEMIRLTCDIARGKISGVLTLFLPEDAVALRKPDAGGQAREGSFGFSELVLTAPVVLDAVLERVTMPLSKVMQLSPGMCLPIDATAIGRTELVAAKGHVAALARLGQMNGFRALRLTGTPQDAPSLAPAPADDAAGAAGASDAGDGAKPAAPGDAPSRPPRKSTAPPAPEPSPPPSSDIADAPAAPDLPGLPGLPGLAGPPATPAGDDEAPAGLSALPALGTAS